jgi:polyisoprenoid-binding protein YceI
MPLARLRVLAFAIFTCWVNQIAESRSLWTVDPAHTPVAFVIDAVGWPQIQGRFTNFQGKIAIDFNNPSASSVSFKVFAASVDVGSSSFNDFLRGEFEAARTIPSLSRQGITRRHGSPRRSEPR